MAIAVDDLKKVKARGDVVLRNTKKHPNQHAFVKSKAKRIIIRAGRRGGKTVGVAMKAIRAFNDGKRVLYAAPTQDQVETFWWEIKKALAEPIEAEDLYKNESLHLVEVPESKQRIRAKTAFNADTLRGDYADLLILDEWQLMDEKAWELVGAPMLLDNDGDAVFIYTPPSLKTRSMSKARDKRHAAKLFAKAQQDKTGRWATFHFSSHDNPFISADALEDISVDMTSLAYKQEILAEDVDEVPGALWTRKMILYKQPADFRRIVIGVDPAGSSSDTSDHTGIIAGAVDVNDEGFVLEDCSLRATPERWARTVIAAYERHEADLVVAEKNNGGEMVRSTIHSVDESIPVKLVHASRGKLTRAEPVSAKYEQGKVFHVKEFPELEDEMCSYDGTGNSPDRMDACVWTLTELMLQKKARWRPAE